MNYWLRARLLVTVLAVNVLVVGLATFAGYFAQLHEAEELQDAQLAQFSRMISYAQMPDVIDANPIEIDFWHATPSQESKSETGGASHVSGHHYEKKLAFQMWDETGQRLEAHSVNMPAAGLLPLTPGFSNFEMNAHRWRSFILQEPAGKRRYILVADRDDIRAEIARDIALQSVVPVLIGLPLLSVLLWCVIGFSLRPLCRMADQLRLRSPVDMEPLNVQSAPREILSVVESLNMLFVRLQSAFDSERRFSADAAHELRTPVSAIRVNLENALCEQGVAQQRSIDVALLAAKRISDSIEQLLILSRLSHDAVMQGQGVLLLNALIREVAAQHVEAAAARHISLQVDLPLDVSITGHAGLISILLRNLVDNAIKYTPEKGAVILSCGLSAGQAWLKVADTGQGIPHAQHSRVFDRFYRVDGDQHASETSGSGLGLSIVRKIADLHGAAIAMEHAAHNNGLVIIVTFPAKALHPTQ